MPNTSYDTDLTDAAWALVEPLLPAAKTGGRPRTTDTRAVLNGIFYLLRSGCQWRLLPHEFPPWGTVYYYFRSWDNAGVWVHLQRALYEQTRVAAGRETCPSVVIMDGQSVKTTERGGVRGFDGHKRIKGRKRHILVDTLGLPIASRVEPANMSDKTRRSPSGGWVEPSVSQDSHGDGRCRSHQWQARPGDLARRGLEVADLQTAAASLQDHRTHLDCGAHVRLARPQSSIQQGLRVSGANIGDSARHCRHPSYAQSPGTGMKLLKRPLNPCERFSEVSRRTD